MTTTYRLATDGVIRIEARASVPGVAETFVPAAEGNDDFAAYQAWLAAGNKPAPADAPDLRSMVVDSVQQRLDEFALTGGFDNITNACSYPSSKNPVRRARSLYALDARDAYWDKCEEIELAVRAGTRPMPTLQEVMAAMPPLRWPA